MNWLRVSPLILALGLVATGRADDTQDLDFYLFLSQFTDENGDWNAPEITDDESDDETAGRQSEAEDDE